MTVQISCLAFCFSHWVIEWVVKEFAGAIAECIGTNAAIEHPHRSCWPAATSPTAWQESSQGTPTMIRTNKIPRQLQLLHFQPFLCNVSCITICLRFLTNRRADVARLTLQRQWRPLHESFACAVYGYTYQWNASIFHYWDRCSMHPELVSMAHSQKHGQSTRMKQLCSFGWEFMISRRETLILLQEILSVCVGHKNLIQIINSIHALLKQGLPTQPAGVKGPFVSFTLTFSCGVWIGKCIYVFWGVQWQNQTSCPAIWHIIIKLHHSDDCSGIYGGRPIIVSRLKLQHSKSVTLIYVIMPIGKTQLRQWLLTLWLEMVSLVLKLYLHFMFYWHAWGNFHKHIAMPS